MRASSVVFLGLSACAPSVPPAPPAPPMHMVSATILVSHCTNLGATNAKLAQTTMDRLVDGCGSFSGSPVRFTMTLLPGGAMQFESQGDAGPSPAIPICLLNHPLTHTVYLQKACSLDVQLEAKSMTSPRPSASPPSAP